MWNLYEGGQFLEPLVFSNGKNQEHVTQEILEKIKSGQRIIFLRGACGTGKSAIALNLAKELGKTSIVVPGKVLQEQYKKDYEGKKYIVKNNNKKLKINLITGRNNHECQFLKDNKVAIPKLKKEINAKLHDIFSGKYEEAKRAIEKDKSADNKALPCKIELREKNWEKIKTYLRQNKLIDSSKLTDIKDVKRVSVASVCPYWSPVFKSAYEFKGPVFKKAKARTYRGLQGTDFTFYERRIGCPYYAQFNHFIDSDVIVFNAQKYLLETAMNRKPLTEVEVIDECDEFLDSFSNKKTLNLDRLHNTLLQEVRQREDFDEGFEEFFSIISHLKKTFEFKRIDEEEIIPIKKTGLYDLLMMLQKNPGMFDEFDDESYLFSVKEIAEVFRDIMDETYVTVTKKEKNIFFDIVAVNLAKRFTEIIDKNKVLVLMSGTLHSKEVLRTIFGIDSFCVLDAEAHAPGEINVVKTGEEKNWKYANVSKADHTREAYLKSLNRCVGVSKKPTVVHINAFMDLPSDVEKEVFSLNHLMSRETLIELQKNDKRSEAIKQFKRGEFDVLFSTKVSRGVDFPGAECNSIVFTKYPNPNVKDAFWKILYKTKPQHYWAFYKDKAKRELLQKVYRGLRFKEDKVEVLSPDKRVLEFFEEQN